MSSLLIVTWLQILPEALPVGLLPDSAPSYAPSVVQVHLPWSWFAVSLLTRLLSFPKSAMNPTLSSPWILSCNPCLKNTHGVKGSRRVGQHLSQEARWENTGKKKNGGTWGKCSLLLADTLGKRALILTVCRQVLPPAIKSSPSSECQISWSWSLLKLRPCASSFLYKYFN